MHFEGSTCLGNMRLERSSEVWQRFLSVAQHNASRTAITNEVLDWTYAQLQTCCEEVARALGKREGLRVGVALASGPEQTAVQLACLATGSTFVPMPETPTASEAITYLHGCPLDIVVCSDAALGVYSKAAKTYGAQCYRLSELRSPSCSIGKAKPSALPANVAMIQFTSGSTGIPKGILLTEAMLTANLRQSDAFLAQFSGHAVYCPLPQFHAMGGAVVLEHLLVGSSVHVSNGFNPAFEAKRMLDTKCAALLTSPKHATMLLRLRILSAKTLPELGHVVLGTGPVSLELVAGIQGANPNTAVHVRYGLSESVGTLTRLSLKPGQTMPRQGLVGHALPGVELREEDGELLVRAPTCAEFQLGTASAAAQLLCDDGFLATGDEVELTSEGVCLGGRRSSFLKVDGYRIDPVEIENVLRSIAAIADVVVVGVADDATGQQVVACIERVSGAIDVDEEALKKACKTALSTHKIPRRFVIVDRLPSTPSGKPDRAAVLRLVH
tara:strand:- start:22511 stop:24007 length:1497 start_codon:yes stop_codon:yes gene_type:complete